MKTESKKTLHKQNEPIAIVGMSCRFPSANTLEEFWSLLKEGRETITEMPSERWNIDDYYDPDPEAANKTNQHHASFLKNIHDFDPLFFNISPAEATEMNPSQKLMLELVWEAIENSSIPYRAVQGTKTGVYVGNIWSDFEHHRKKLNAQVTTHSAVGQSSNIIANRVSFSFGFSGPSLVVDTGCSSSLVALHLACQSLWDESTGLSVVAGINHILDPDQYVLLSKFGGLSSNGKCSTFDANGDGFVRGEGAGVLLLKKLSDAERDGNKIHAVIRGTAMNNNGYNVNLPATSVTGQKQVLHDAYAGSGIRPQDIHYVEAHGTGTKLGDPTESKALGEFFRTGRSKKLHVGSVKTNIGHLEAAAGVAGLIKVVLAMQHRQLPPSLNFKTPNPAIPFDDLKLHVQSTLGSWPADENETLKAGINSFGWGGTNAHTILEEYKNQRDNSVPPKKATKYCLPLSAKSEQALKDYARAYANLLRTQPQQILSICIATALLKPQFEYATLFAGNDVDELVESLETFAAEKDEQGQSAVLTGHDKVVMVFPGQGSQWLGMGRELYEKEQVFRQAIDECNDAFKKYTDWTLIQQLFASHEESRLNEINVIQPSLCAVQIALARLWMSWGIRPHAVVGHSMGEVAAAYISGALNLDDAARIICTRSRLMKTVSGKGGAMAVTELSVAQADEVVKRYPALSIAVSNSPKSTVLAGQQQAVTEVLAELESKGLFARQVKVDVASHSQQMDVLKTDLHDALKAITPLPASVPIYSTVRAQKMNGADLTSEYWVDNLRQTVQFASVMEQLLRDDHTVFIEVSPHPVLANAVNECAEHFKKKIATIDSVYREKPEQGSIYQNLSALFTKGYAIDWKAFYQTNKAPDVTLPSYPFQRERFELTDRSHEALGKNNSARFPLLGEAISLAGDDHTFYWETVVSLSTFPYLVDHQINETPVLPGAAYVEMLFEAATELNDQSVPVVAQLQFIKSIALSKEDQSVIQLKLIQKDKAFSFSFFLKVPGNIGRVTWELLAQGELKLKPKEVTILPVTESSVQNVSTVTGGEYYASLKTLGLQYGKYFQGIKDIQKVSVGFNEEVRFTVAADPRIVALKGKYKTHPALLDAFFQPLFFSVLQDSSAQHSRTTFLTDVGEIEWLGEIDMSEGLLGKAVLKPLKKDEQRGFINVEADILITNAQQVPLLRVTALKGKVIDTALIEQRKEKLKNWLYKVNWVERTTVETMCTEAPKGKWVVFGDPYGVSDILTERMRLKGFDLIHITPGEAYSHNTSSTYTINYAREEDYRHLIGELFAPTSSRIAGIAHIGSMSYTWQDPYLTADIVEQHQAYGSVSFMYLHQQLTALKLSETPQLVIITNGIHTTSSERDVAQPVHSPLWGMAKVMFNELTHFNCRCFDLSANPSIEELELVITQLTLTKAAEHEIAFRGVKQFVPRLGKHIDEERFANEPKEFSSTGTYLVTGYRGLGFVFIEWMIRQGARNFALVSRTGEVTPDLAQRIQVLEKQGCRFRVFKADAGVYHEIRDVVEEIDLSMPELKGVIHAAGIIEARTLTELNQQEFLRILNPKVKGAWNLHLLTQHKMLDCFIMFSSASTLIGLSGQGSYVAANAFLDTLAHSRRRMGLPGMSVNWGVMKDVGMVANKSELQKYAKAEGFEPVSMNEAMEVFHAIYNSEHTQIGILKMHAETMANYYSTLSSTPYFKGLLHKESKSETRQTNFIEQLAVQATADDRIRLLEELVTQQVAKIAKTSTARIRPTMTFKGLGIDSLMAIQLRNLLEKSLNLKLSVAMFWTHPSIHEYAAFLHGTLAEQLLIVNLPEAKKQVSEADPQHWFVTPLPSPNASFRLICFHDAGGNASLYQDWPRLLGDQIELTAVELPGRGRRVHEKPYEDVHLLVRDLKQALLPLIDKPFLFFGHSMGGLIAFELTRELARSKMPLPSSLFISSTPGLTTYTRAEVNPNASMEDLVALFPHLDKTNIGDDELHQYLVNLMRGDLHLLNAYRYQKDSKLNVPIVVVHGNNDPRVTAEQAVKWTEETTSSCDIHVRPGGHRYIDHDSAFLTDLIKFECTQPVPINSRRVVL